MAFGDSLGVLFATFLEEAVDTESAFTDDRYDRTAWHDCLHSFVAVFRVTRRLVFAAITVAFRLGFLASTGSSLESDEVWFSSVCGLMLSAMYAGFRAFIFCHCFISPRANLGENI